MDDLALRLLLGDEPTLDRDVFIESCPEQGAAEQVADRYAALLRQHRLQDRFGVFTRRLPNRGWYGIYLGPHHAT